MPTKPAGLPGITTAELAERLGVAVKTVHSWKGDGKIVGRRVGRVVRFSEAEVARFERERYGELVES